MTRVLPERTDVELDICSPGRLAAIIAPMSRYTFLIALLFGCGGPSAEVESAAPRGAPEIEVTGVSDDTPSGGDGGPRLTLAFRYSDGTRVPIEGQALAYAAFRDGVALVDVKRELALVSPDGSRRVLARESGAPPVRGPGGELFYVARHGLVAEVHALDVGGNDRILASGLSNAGVLAPQADGRLLFVAALSGGVAGVWIAERGASRCLSNCDLKTGVAWGDRFVPLPRDASAIRVAAERVEWDASDGTRRSVALIPSATIPGGASVSSDGESGGAVRAAPAGSAP